jgi:hypothetical protein
MTPVASLLLDVALLATMVNVLLLSLALLLPMKFVAYLYDL